MAKNEYDVILVEGQFGNEPIDLQWSGPDGNLRDFTGFDSLKLYINNRDLGMLVKTITLTNPQLGILRWEIANGDIPTEGRYVMVYEVKDTTTPKELPSQHLNLLVKKKGSLI